MAWLAPAPLLFGLAYLLAQALFARQDERGALLANGVSMGVNIAANLVAIPLLGITGAALVTSVSLGVRVLVARGRVRRAIRSPDLLRPLVPATVAALPLVGLLLLVELPVLLELALGAAVYLPAWWFVTRRRAPEQLEVVRALVSRLVPTGSR
jgi:O-antigen/teichoic acid export membrane protein